MNETQDSESVNYEDQSPVISKDNYYSPSYEDKVSLRPESQESTDSDRIEKSTAELKPSKLLSKPKAEQNTLPRRTAQIIMNVSDTKYAVVRHVGKEVMKWKLSTEPDGNWDLFWTDNAVQPDQLGRMKAYQKINHFPGMYSLAQKNQLGRNLMKMRKAFPLHYEFFPQTWILPAEFGEFKAQFSKKGNKTFIVKPAASCQGRGIFLTRTWENIDPNEFLVAQRYLFKPFLIDGLKFDLRIYVLLAGCDPLRIYMHEEGLARFATEQYANPKGNNLDNLCMHLTNYAINKENPNFVFNESENDGDVGHKRTLTSLWKTLEDMGHNTTDLKEEIKKMIIKTFCSVQPILAHHYRSCQPDDPYNNLCFEILGFDVLIDNKLKPWLIEVNHTPSFATDTPLDHAVKQAVISDAVRLMNVSIQNRFNYQRKLQAELQKLAIRAKRKPRLTPEERQNIVQEAQAERDKWESKNCGRYIKLYPLTKEEITEPYKDMIQEAERLYQAWTGTAVKKNTKRELSMLTPFKAGSNAVANASITVASGFSFGQSSRFAEVNRSPHRKKTIDSSSKPRSNNQDTTSLRSQSTIFSEKKTVVDDNRSSLDFPAAQRIDLKSLDLESKEQPISVEASPRLLNNKQENPNSETNSLQVSQIASPHGLSNNLTSVALTTELAEPALFLYKSMPPATIKHAPATESREHSPTTSNQKPRNIVEGAAGNLVPNQNLLSMPTFQDLRLYPITSTLIEENSKHQLFKENQRSGKSISLTGLPENESESKERVFNPPQRSITQKLATISHIESEPLKDKHKDKARQVSLKYPIKQQTQSLETEQLKITREEFASKLLGNTNQSNMSSQPTKGIFLQPKIMNLNMDGWLRPEATSFRIKKIPNLSNQNRADFYDKQPLTKAKSYGEKEAKSIKTENIQEFIRALQRIRRQKLQKP